MGLTYVNDVDWPLSTDYDANIMCEACDDLGILLSPFTEPQGWKFTVTQLLVLIAEHRKICRKRSDPRSKRTVYTLCGSTRFKDEIRALDAKLTMLGHIVISLGVFGHVDMPEHDWTTNGSELKKMLDGLHRAKIDLSDAIFVVNVGGYIGESTRAEIEYAVSTGKAVFYLE